MMVNSNKSTAIIITTVALALFTIFWSKLDSQLEALDTRLRCVEQQIAAISSRLGVENRGQSSQQRSSAGPPAAARRNDSRAAIPITP